MRLPLPSKLATGLGLALIAALACSSGESFSGIAENADIIVVTLDTVRADRIGGYGYEPAMTSEIDGFLDQAVVFEEAHVTRALTEPSLASMWTGLYTYQHGVVANGYQALDPMPHDLVRALKKAGYTTHAIAANGCKVFRQFDWDSMKCIQNQDSRVIDEARQILDQEASQPRLVWLHLFAGHGPYNSGRGHAKRSFPNYKGQAAGGKAALDQLSRSKEVSEEDLAYLQARYDGSLHQLDTRLGRLFAVLDSNKVVVLAADHGEELGDHDSYFFHACSTYRAGLRVPLAIRVPGIQPRRVRRMVELRDLATTILDVVGVEAEVAGQNILDPKSRTPATYSAFDTYPIWTVQDSGWRLVVNPENVALRCFPGADFGAMAIAEVELYRLADDPNEQTNLADQLPDQVAAMRSKLEAWSGYGRASQKQDLDEQTRKELEALGYVN